MFSKYHYLSHSHNNAARVFLLVVNDELAGFSSVLPFPHPILKNHWKEHRTVLFPDYQGVGLGGKLSGEVAEILKKAGKGYISTSSNPAFIYARSKSSKWIVTRKGRNSSGSGNGKIQNKNKKGSTSSSRITVSFKYIG